MATEAEISHVSLASEMEQVQECRGLWKPEKARKPIVPRASRRSTALPTPRPLRL